MPSRNSSRIIAYVLALSLALMVVCVAPVRAQQEEPDTFGDEAADPVVLFDRGQDAHQKGNFKLALEFYAEAIKLRPEFPEAEFQKAQVLRELHREAEAEQAYRRAATLRPNWSLPPAMLGSLLVQLKREEEAQPLLQRAIELDPRNYGAAHALSNILIRKGDKAGALAIWRRATGRFTSDIDPKIWRMRCEIEAKVDVQPGIDCFTRLIDVDASHGPDRVKRAELRVKADDKEGAIEDLRAAADWLARLPENKAEIDAALAVSSLYATLGRTTEALQVLDYLPPALKNSTEANSLRAKITASGGDSPEATAELEKILEREPENAAVLARLGELYRTSDPQRSLNYYRHALSIEPNNVNYATGFGAALVQLRSFDRAAEVLRQVVAAAPDNYAAHANLATALDELKQYREALEQYKWLNQKRPELAVTHFLIARAHDLLGEYAEALAAYETFLARANPQNDQLQIEKVMLRLPSLRNQIKRGEGVKSKGRQKN